MIKQISLLLLGIQLCVARIPSDPRNLPLYNPDFDDTQCGGIIDAEVDQILGIQYKTLVPYERNERCVWIVRAPNATGFQIELVFADFGYPSDFHAVTVSSLYPMSDYGDRMVDIPHTPRIGSTAGVAGSVLVVTFYSGNYTSGDRGFILSVTPTFTPTGNQASNLSVNYIADSSFGTVRHPSSGQYPAQDVSVFVFIPSQIYAPGKLLNVVYSKTGLDAGEDDSCPDHLFVFKFDMEKDTSYKWSTPEKICGDKEVTLAQHSDLMMIIFRSDGQNGGDGFHLTHTTCG